MPSRGCEFSFFFQLQPVHLLLAETCNFHLTLHLTTFLYHSPLCDLDFTHLSLLDLVTLNRMLHFLKSIDQDLFPLIAFSTRDVFLISHSTYDAPIPLANADSPTFQTQLIKYLLLSLSPLVFSKLLLPLHASSLLINLNCATIKYLI